MTTARSLPIARAFLIALRFSCATARPLTAVERPAFEVRFDVPSVWVGEVTAATESDETLTFTAPGRLSWR